MKKNVLSQSLREVAARCAPGAGRPLAPPLFVQGEDVAVHQVTVCVEQLLCGGHRWAYVQVLEVGADQVEELARWSVVPPGEVGADVVLHGVEWLLAACVLSGLRPDWVEAEVWEDLGEPVLVHGGRAVVWLEPGRARARGSVPLAGVLANGPVAVEPGAPWEVQDVAGALVALERRVVPVAVWSGSVADVLGWCLRAAAEDAYASFGG
jgi:hypothetical protein